jgi:uncharacterized protein (TIGR02996 family)
MREEQALIEAITADPACNDTRLVYADWLEEHSKPSEADFLRTELQLAALSPEAPEARALRDRLWKGWATVEPRWLMMFTQPQMLRANPTPFPSMWTNFDLGDLREVDGTYGRWPYESLPPLPLDELRGEFQYLKPKRRKSRTARDGFEDYRKAFEQMLSDASAKGFPLPASFVTLLRDPTVFNALDSVTDCYFTLPDETSPMQIGPCGEGAHFHFYSDSQSCALWDLYIHPSGAHCVVERGFEYLAPDAESMEEEGTSPVSFVAPSFEAFVYRVWIENQVWYIQNVDFLRSRGQKPPAITPAIQAYMDAYRGDPD